jgi:hypothetical protein
MRAFEEKRKRTRRRHEKEFAQLDHRGRPKKNLKFMSERFTSIASTTIVVCGGHFFRTGEVFFQIDQCIQETGEFPR